MYNQSWLTAGWIFDSAGILLVGLVCLFLYLFICDSMLKCVFVTLSVCYNFWARNLFSFHRRHLMCCESVLGKKGIGGRNNTPTTITYWQFTNVPCTRYNGNIANNVLGESNHNGWRRWCLSMNIKKSRRLLVDCHHVNLVGFASPFLALLYPFSPIFHLFSSFLSSSLFCAHAHVTGYWKKQWEKSTYSHVCGCPSIY
jgi:hypothetical protein